MATAESPSTRKLSPHIYYGKNCILLAKRRHKDGTMCITLPCECRVRYFERLLKVAFCHLGRHRGLLQLSVKFIESG